MARTNPHETLVDFGEPTAPSFAIERRELIGEVSITEGHGPHPIHVALEVIANQLIMDSANVHTPGDHVHTRFTFNFQGQLVEVNAGDFTSDCR